ncbi:MAG: transglycosylase SLT domain-containing protein [Saprospiraceae bacterium]|nr:transglycosylase SLT domain-containing protein [Saprospiraceae bacterium]
MNILKSIPVGLLYCALLSPTGSLQASESGHRYSIDEMEDRIKTGIESSVQIVRPTYDARVRSYLRMYIELSPQQTEIMMGRADLYFDLFETYLDKYNMPRDLKYLAVVESALKPGATSHSGAGGIWQFMRATGREYGLRITQYIDERRDPEKSTDAAVRYLQKLYERFGSWELAMAAYNAGPGRVSSAIRRSGTTDYWKLSRYLPRETRAYVPGFIAVNYLFNHYAAHNLQPQSPDPDLLHTAEMPVFDGISLAEVSKVTGVPYRTIKWLNPVYARNWIPRSTAGYPLRLPEYAIGVMEEFLGYPNEEVSHPVADTDEPFEEIRRTILHEVNETDDLYTIARTYECAVRELMQWNGLKTAQITPGSDLTIHLVERIPVRPSLEERLVTPVEQLAPVTTPPLTVPDRQVPVMTAESLLTSAMLHQDPVLSRRRMRVRDAIRAERRNAQLKDRGHLVSPPVSAIRFK